MKQIIFGVMLLLPFGASAQKTHGNTIISASSYAIYQYLGETGQWYKTAQTEGDYKVVINSDETTFKLCKDNQCHVLTITEKREENDQIWQYAIIGPEQVEVIVTINLAAGNIQMKSGEHIEYLKLRQ